MHMRSMDKDKWKKNIYFKFLKNEKLFFVTAASLNINF